MITITKRGPIYLNNKIICNRPGIVAEAIYDEETNVGVNPDINNPFTISYACEGTLISFFSIKKTGLSSSTLDRAWFMDFEKAYFLCTLNKLDGYTSYWNDKIDFGQIILSNVSEVDFQMLDSNFAWTFLLTHKTLKLLYIWDINHQQYISPLSSLWKVPQFCKENKFIVKKDGIQSTLTKKQMRCPLIESGVQLLNNRPILITIYCKNIIYLIRVMTRIDLFVNKIRNRSIDKFEALLLSRFKMEDTYEFEKRYFTNSEITDFDYRLKLGFEKFKEEIYQKTVLRNWVCFPDKIYNTIRLGDILDMNISCLEKQERACEAIKLCTKGWKQKALFEFYKAYVE